MLKNHPWKTLSYQQVIDTPYLKIRCEQVAVPNGPVIPDYYIIENRGWVGIVPLTEDGRFLLNNQYKHGIGSEVLEFPAGGIDSYEDDPIITARRELMEETGYSFEDHEVELLAHMLANPTGRVRESGGTWHVTCVKRAYLKRSCRGHRKFAGNAWRIASIDLQWQLCCTGTDCRCLYGS